MRFLAVLLFALVAVTFAAPVPDIHAEPDLVAREAEANAEADPGCRKDCL